MRVGRLLSCLTVALGLFATASSYRYEDQEDLLPNYEDLERLDELRRYIWRAGANRRAAGDEFESWTGRWMPERDGDPTPPPKIFKNNGINGNPPSETLHGVAMGHPSDMCDDAKTNLTVDWDYSPVNYTCYDSKIRPDRTSIAKLYCEMVPKHYVAMHKCMNDRIEYDDDLPLFGTHRPLWPVYGEYKFLPRQRWLHSLEHGGIVMLYHPCANPLEVKRLKSLVTGCLRRHVITPYNLLDEERPLALLSWGCRLTMSYVNPSIVKKFIQEYALKGPEAIPRDGDYKELLLKQARTTSDEVDSVLCPNGMYS